MIVEMGGGEKGGFTAHTREALGHAVFICIFASLPGLGEEKDEERKLRMGRKTGASNTTLGYLRQGRPL
jgi:hypothetical protein